MVRLSGWPVSGGPGLVWLHLVCGCEGGWMCCQILRNTLETSYGREMNIHFTGNISAVSMLVAPSKHLWRRAV